MSVFLPRDEQMQYFLDGVLMCIFELESQPEFARKDCMDCLSQPTHLLVHCSWDTAGTSVSHSGDLISKNWFLHLKIVYSWISQILSSWLLPQPWPEDALERVASKFLETLQLSDTERQGVVPICKYFHTSVLSLSERSVYGFCKQS